MKENPNHDIEEVGNWAEFASKTKLRHGQDKQVIAYETLMIFTLFNQKYALLIEEIKEIIPIPHITPIPQTPEHILGVGNVRGTVMAMLDLNVRILKESYGNSKYVVVLKSEDVKLGLLIKQPPMTLQVEKTKIDTSSSALKSLTTEDDFIRGIYKQDKEMIFILDIHKL